MLRYYYSNEISSFLHEDPNFILGILTKNHQFALELSERYAWEGQIQTLQTCLKFLDHGCVLFEYSIPRMGKRVDTILLTHGVVFVIEFKVGENEYTAHALDQVLDYALDLKNFHQYSHDKLIVPILVATEAAEVTNVFESYEDLVFRPLKANSRNLQKLLKDFTSVHASPKFDSNEWIQSGYRPTPTIIEAAQALYRGHSVSEISRSDAGATNLSITSNAVYEIIKEAKEKQQKVICFITGVPGAGKTLAGLNIANEYLIPGNNDHAVFLSGNGPLVQVLREALARNEVEKSASEGKRITKSTATKKVQAFIQNIHHFRDEALVDKRAPVDKVVIFDEAQRAWDQDQTAKFMQKKRNHHNFSMSEPEFLISVMDRHPDWAVIICLIGGGQEIHTGEAGLQEWFSALRVKFPHWYVYTSNKINEKEYSWDDNLVEFINSKQLHINHHLHLGISIRSFRSEKVSAFIKAILDNEAETAREYYIAIKDFYPITITRDINKAKQWVRSKARGTERYGILASSGGYRLRPIGIHVNEDIDIVRWFLDGKQDVRSSFYLEQVATEFDVQGLELDWTCVVWDGDLRYQHGKWEHLNFHGSKWQKVNNLQRQMYLVNAYRVLLTRARQGMVIVVPYGNYEDDTRKPAYYDQTYEFLTGIGIAEL